MPPVPLTNEQLGFADEYAESFKCAIEHIVNNPPSDPLDELLSGWLIVLGVLAYNNFASIVTLLRAGHTRSAWMFYRCLIDYHARMRYYILQSKPARLKYEASNKRGPLNYLRMMRAWRDWHNATEKEYALLRNRPLDLTMMSSAQRVKFLTLLQGDHQVYRQHARRMMAVAEPQDELFRFMYSTWLFQSAYIHGDQVAIPEIFENPDGKIRVTWESEGASPFHTLGESIMYMQFFLESVQMVRGWAYGYYRMWRLARELFIPTFERVNAENEARSGMKDEGLGARPELL